MTGQEDVNTTVSILDMMSLVDNYRARLVGEGKSKATVDIYCRVARWLIEFKPNINELTKEDALRFRDQMAARVQSSSMTAPVAAVNSFAKFLGKEDIRVKPPRPRRKIIEPLSQGEVLRLVEASRHHADEKLAIRNRAIVTTLLEGAFRRSELSKALMEDVHLSTGEIVIRAPKGRHDRRVYLNASAMETLKAYLEVRPKAKSPEEDAYLFLAIDGKRLSSSMIYEVVKEAAARAHIEREVWPHLLRHTKLTQLGENMAPFLLQKFAGHANINQTMSYVHASDEAVRTEVLSRPLLMIEDAPKVKPPAPPVDAQSMLMALTMRLATGEISEETYNRAISTMQVANTATMAQLI